jgi:hypothetical protein
MGERRQQIQQMAGRRLIHFSLELALETFPGFFVCRCLGLGH